MQSTLIYITVFLYRESYILIVPGKTGQGVRESCQGGGMRPARYSATGMHVRGPAPHCLHTSPLRGKNLPLCLMLTVESKLGRLELFCKSNMLVFSQDRKISPPEFLQHRKRLLPKTCSIIFIHNMLHSGGQHL